MDDLPEIGEKFIEITRNIIKQLDEGTGQTKSKSFNFEL